MAANEALGGKTPIGADLDAGVDLLSMQQTITFQKYVRLVLPLDGYVFWVKVGVASPSALLNVMELNQVTLNQAGEEPSPSKFIARGSLHYATDSRQTEASNISTNRVVFTALQPVQDLNQIGSDELYIGTFDGPAPGQLQTGPTGTTAIRFAFSSRSSFYKQANLWHYVGYAIYPTMETQIIDNPQLLDTTKLIVSNSLPLWLNFNHYNPTWPVPVPRPRVSFYPSFLVPDNKRPAYVAVHIDPANTEAQQSQPFMSSMTDSYVLARDRVTLTLYGCDNQVASDIRDSLLQYSFDTELWGVMNIPVIADDKEGQNEINTLAQKKKMVFDVSYNQAAIRNVARQLIESCVPTVFVGEEVIN